MELPFRIPDSLLPVLLGLSLWFGACYVYFAPELTERAIAMHVKEECTSGANPNMCSCVLADIQTGSGSFNNAVFLASFGLSEPRVKIWNNEQNPYIQYVSLQMSDQSRRKTCDAPTLDLVAQAEKAAQKKIAIEKEKADKAAQKALDVQKQLHQDELKKIREANQQLVEDTNKKLKEVAENSTKKLKEVADAAKNNPVVVAVKKEFEEQTAQAIRIHKLKNDLINQGIGWGEYTVKKSEKTLRELEYKLRRYQQ